jgi:hypothetical protein
MGVPLLCTFSLPSFINPCLYIHCNNVCRVVDELVRSGLLVQCSGLLMRSSLLILCFVNACRVVDELVRSGLLSALANLADLDMRSAF